MHNRVGQAHGRHSFSIAAIILLITCAAVLIHLSKSKFSKESSLHSSVVIQSQMQEWSQEARSNVRRNSLSRPWNDWSVLGGDGNCLTIDSRIEHTNTTGRWSRQIVVQLPDPLVANSVYDLRAVDLSEEVLARPMNNGEVLIREFSSPFGFVLNNELYPLTGSLRVVSISEDRVRADLQLSTILVDWLDPSETRKTSITCELVFFNSKLP